MSRIHQARLRRAERAPLTDAGGLNLVPLVDVLTSIVFFGLLTYTGAAMSMLTSFDLVLPPVVVTAEPPGASAQEPPPLNLLLAVKIQNGRIVVEHSEENGFRREVGGLDSASFQQLGTLLSEIRTRYPQNNQVLVVPDDATNYDDIISVLEQAKLARFSAIALGSRARATQVATNTGGR